jgi:sugar phosphate isomerase/epimerase
LGLSALAPGAAALGELVGLQGEEPLFRISLAEWSLHRTLGAGEMTNLDFPAVARERFGIEAVEYVNSFFKQEATNFAYLRQLEQRCADAGVRSLLIMCDGEGQLGDEDRDARRAAVRNHYRWIAAASFLGCHSIRVNAAGGGPPEETAKRAADSLHQLAEYGDPYGISVIVENHGGSSSNGAWLAGVMRLADHSGVGTLPDFGNFHLGNDQWYDRYQGVSELMPFAKAVSAKSHEFDEAGDEVRTDYRRMLKIVLDSGDRGWVGVEYEGDKHSEEEGIQLTKALLERVREEL